MGLKAAARAVERSPKMGEGMGKKGGKWDMGSPTAAQCSPQAAPTQSHSKLNTKPQLKNSLSFYMIITVIITGP